MKRQWKFGSAMMAIALATSALSQPATFSCGSVSQCERYAGPDAKRLMEAWYAPTATPEQHAAMRRAIEAHTVGGNIAWGDAASAYFTEQARATTPAPATPDVDADALEAQAIADLQKIEADKRKIFKEACGNHEAYLQIFQMATDRDREMLKATCAAHHSAPRHKR